MYNLIHVRGATSTTGPSTHWRSVHEIIIIIIETAVIVIIVYTVAKVINIYLFSSNPHVIYDLYYIKQHKMTPLPILVTRVAPDITSGSGRIWPPDMRSDLTIFRCICLSVIEQNSLFYKFGNLHLSISS